MKIIALVDLDEVSRDDPQFQSDSWAAKRSMEFSVASALRSLKHDVLVLPFGPDVEETVRQLKNSGADLVFNLTEQLGGDRSKDQNIAAVLDLLNIPYTGSGPTGLMIGRDKALSKRVVGYHGVAVPAFATFPVGEIKVNRENTLPAIVKLQISDGSRGLSLRSVVRHKYELEAQVRDMHQSTGEAVICEQYIEGREITVFVTGNQKLRAFPAAEIRFGGRDGRGPAIATARVVTDENYRKKWGITYGPAGLPHDLEARVARISKKIYRLLSLRDYARLDLRLTSSGEIFFIEANPNPALFPSGFGAVPSWAGIDFSNFMGQIVKLAMQRQRN